ncbi:MAG: hypothetical protein AAF961_07795, partial [Planctomycetota bacterium]
MPRRKTFRFSIRWMMAVTTAVALVVGTAWALEAPDEIRLVVAVYLGLLALWALFRGAQIYAGLANVNRRRRELQRRREALFARYSDPRPPD